MRALATLAKYILAGAAALAALASFDTAHAATLHVLYRFTGGSDGLAPEAGLIKDSAGNLYGTTVEGGDQFGTVFKLAPDGTETVLHAFTTGNDGAYPEAGVIKDSAGSLYGTTNAGGSYGLGTVFKLAPDGTETVLYVFTGGSDGALPSASLIKDSAGNLYGTTVQGGANQYGTVFKLAPDGTETVLHAFSGGNDGAYPEAGVIKDSSGNLYGTTTYGGSYGSGTVFKLAPDGTETVLYAFTGGNDGADPKAGLIKDSAGNLYGTTYEGGSTGCHQYGCGTIFKVAPDGTETVLHAFTGGSDGALPEAGLIKDSAGNLYGTTFGGGSTCSHGYGCGTAFELAPDGIETVLYAFTHRSDGRYPVAGLIKDKAGNLYGTTGSGGSTGCGSLGCGTVFKLTK